MSALPGWLLDVRNTLPGWIDAVSHSDGWGRYRFAVDAYEPYDLDSSHLMHNVVFTTGGGTAGLPDDAGRAAWCEYLRGMQRPEDGIMLDEGMERHILSEHAEPTAEEVFNVRRFTTRNGLTTLMDMGGKPAHPLAHQESFETPAEIVTYLEGLHWDNPWGAGSWAGAAVMFQHFNRLLGDEEADVIIAAAVDWLAQSQDPETGAWSDGACTSLHQLINGIFKVWIQVCAVANLPVQYPEQVIDLCIRGLREDPALTGTPDACSIFDVAFVLDVALSFTDHRRDEVAEIAVGFLPSFEPMVRADGAFSYGPDGSLKSHGGLHLAPVKMQSDLAGTAINCHAIAILSNLSGLREELGWVPVSEWRGISPRN